MPAETEATKGISNQVVVDYFYIMFWIVGLTTALVLLLELYAMSVSPGRGLAMFLRSAPTLFLALANAAFLYILSARALN
jgi:hypothetical protein